jgi:hypothetical protein
VADGAQGVLTAMATTRSLQVTQLTIRATDGIDHMHAAAGRTIPVACTPVVAEYVFGTPYVPRPLLRPFSHPHPNREHRP